MKIYPSKHRVYFKKQAPVDSIPLSYVYNEEQDREIKISVEPDFSKPEEESLIMPYQQFDTWDVMIFDKKKEPVKNVTQYLKQKQGSSGLYYIPQQVSEFIPKSFSYSMLLQREEEYKKSTEYPVSIGIEIQDSTLFQAVISQVFAACCNPKETQLYPSNFVINGNASTESSFIGALADHYDLIITTVADLGKKLDESHLMIQDVLEDFYFKNNINVWIIGEQFTPIYNTAETYSEEEEPNNNMILQIEGENSDYFSLAETILYSKNYGNLPTYYVTDEEGNKKTIRFSADTSWIEAADNTYESIEFFAEGCPLRIFSKKDLGFLILSHPVFFKNLNLAENEGAMAKLFFEVLAYVYFHGYFRIPYQTGFITDEPIDYMLHTGESYLLTHGRMPVDSILTKAGYNSQIGYRIAGVDVRIPDEETGNYTVKYSGLNRFGHLIFSKQAGKTKDPEKGKTQSDVSYCRFCVAVDRGYVKEGEERTADFIDCLAWRGTADFIAKWFHKGDAIGVAGAMQTGTYEKDGVKRKTYELVVREASFAGKRTQEEKPAESPVDGFTPLTDDDVPF